MKLGAASLFHALFFPFTPALSLQWLWLQFWQWRGQNSSSGAWCPGQWYHMAEGSIGHEDVTSFFDAEKQYLNHNSANISYKK